MLTTPNTLAETLALGVRAAYNATEVRPAFDAALEGHPRWRDVLRAGIAAQLEANQFAGAEAAARLLVPSSNGKGSHATTPTLADIWSESLGAFLDPDPFLLRPSNAGMGKPFDYMLGGGLSLGQTLNLGAFGAGGGKTAFLHQWADGVAEATATAAITETGDPIPVVYASEMTVRDLTLRSLARQAKVEGFLLRDPKGERGCEPIAGCGVTEGENAREKALLAAEWFRQGARHMTVLDRSTRVTIDKLRAIVHQVRDEWDERGRPVRTIALFVDPVHQLIDRRRDAVEAIGEVLALLLEFVQTEKLIAILASETKFASASTRSLAGGRKTEELADMVEQAFRGSYELMHMPDNAVGLLTLSADDENLDEEARERLQQEPEGTLYAEVVSPKARWQRRALRAAYHFHAAEFRFEPVQQRTAAGDAPLRDRVIEFIRRNPGCSQKMVRKGVAGATDLIIVEVNKLTMAGIVEDRKSGNYSALYLKGAG